jgi:hypothetical protein
MIDPIHTIRLLYWDARGRPFGFKKVSIARTLVLQQNKMNVFRLDETKAAEQERNGGTDANVARSNSPAPGSRKDIGNAGDAKPRGPIPRPQTEDRISGGVAIPRS